MTIPTLSRVFFTFGLAACVAFWRPFPGASTSTQLSEADTLSVVDSLIYAAIADRAFPGAALAVGVAGEMTELKAYGSYTYRGRTPVTPESVFDMASLTKVIATSTVAMLLYEEGRIDLDAPVRYYVPEFSQNGKERVTIRHLLTHTSGLRPYIFFHEIGITDRDVVLDSIMADALVTKPDERSRYSDFSMIMLAIVIEQITGQDLASYAREHVFEPLGMHATGFRGTGTPDTTVVPTECDNYFRYRQLQGEVHDETAWILGGAAGHAGLFSSATDVARFASMMTRGGIVDGLQFLKPETIHMFTTAVDTSSHTRALGWDTKSPDGPSAAGDYFGARSYGHTGYTGTSMWIDPDRQLFVVLLTNRVFPTRKNTGHIDVRRAVADRIYEEHFGVPEWAPVE